MSKALSLIEYDTPRNHQSYLNWTKLTYRIYWGSKMPVIFSMNTWEASIISFWSQIKTKTQISLSLQPVQYTLNPRLVPCCHFPMQITQVILPSHKCVVISITKKFARYIKSQKTWNLIYQVAVKKTVRFQDSFLSP